MQTSTGDSQVYERAGVVRFEVDGEPAEVTLYRPKGEDSLFLPFRDPTRAQQTYGAGRSTWPRRIIPTVAEATSSSTSITPTTHRAPTTPRTFICSSLPPRENWLKVPICAGEKKLRRGRH